MIRRAVLWTAVAVVAMAAGCERSSDTGAPAAPTTTAPTTAPASPARWRPTTHPGCFDPGDLLEVRVMGLTAPNATDGLPARVQSDGTLGLPYLSHPVPVAYVDRAEAVKRIAAAFRNDNVLANPEVAVRRLEVAGTGASAPGPIAPYDLVRCEIQSLISSNQSAIAVGRVDGDGRIAVPLLPPTAVAGQSEVAAAATLAKGYHDANILSQPQVSVLVLERAPANAAHIALPDGPLDPVPETLRPLYVPR